MELLVPLTWPVELHSQMTVNHHRHVPYLQQAQVQYKRGILSHGNSGLLRTTISIGLPSMAIARSERTTRDEGILKLMLYLIRNVAVIAPDTRLVAEGDEEETSRSATINAFQQQDVFALLLTMCSNMGDDFNLQDIVLLEIIFHIVKGVDVEKLFMNDAQRKAKRTDELSGLLKKEASLQREYARNAPTRHGRFGTMIWVKRDDAKVSTVSGQDVLKDGQATLFKMDQSKKWNRPQPRRKHDGLDANNDFNTPAHLSLSASKNLRTFVEEFLDSGFNPLFIHVRKAIEREADRVTDINTRQFFYTAAWLLQAERVRRVRQNEQHQRNNEKSRELQPDSFGLVASVLTQEMFVFLNRSMQYSLDHKDWEDLNAEMRCFTQILLTVQEMTLSPLEEDQEIAENIQNRIFYEETTLDRVLTIARGFKDQGFGYLDACTELVHIFLRVLERYSKQNTDMQVRSRRRARRKKRAEHASEHGNEQVLDEEQDSEEEDLAEAERVSRERKFDFNRFAARFCNQKCVDTFVAFTRFYRDLNAEQLKRAHRYFYRIAFKQEMSVLLFRVDIINMFYRMIKGPGALDSSSPIFKEWEELVRQLIRRLVKKIDQRPAMITELLFSKINSTLFYLEYGHEKQTMSRRRPPAELEVDIKEASTPEEQLEVVVAVLIMDEQAELVKWISDVLGSAADEREAWEAQEEARRAESPTTAVVPNPIITVKPCDESCEEAMFSNAKLRLLMMLIHFERLGFEDVAGASWAVPSALTSKELRDTKKSIDSHLANPITEFKGQDPHQLIRRKNDSATRGNTYQPTLDVDFGSESEGEEVPDGPLFPPNPRSKSTALDELRKRRKKKRQEDGEGEPLDDEKLEERRHARLANSLARQAKIKSDLFIHESDEETDEEADREFFLLEEKRRQAQAERVRQALLTGAVDQTVGKTGKGKGKKRKSETHKIPDTGTERKRQRGSSEDLADANDTGDEDAIMADVLSQSPHGDTLHSHDAEDVGNTPPTSAGDDMDFDDDLAFGRDRRLKPDSPVDPQPNGADSQDEDENVPVTAPLRKRMRAGFIIDSDSE